MTPPRSCRTALAALAAGVALLIAASAGAQDNPRRHPDYYRGRARQVTPGEAALWVPRVVLFPIHVITEFVIRRPVRAAVSLVEQNHVPAYVHTIFNPTPDFAWSPTFIADLGLMTSGGLRMRWNNALVRHNELRLSASTGGIDFWHLAGQDRIVLGPLIFGVRGDYLTRPDREFHGIGNQTAGNDALGYYRLTRGDALGFMALNPSHHFTLELSGGWRRETTGNGWGPYGPPIVERFEQNVYAPPPGFGDLSLALAQANLVVDSRPRVQMDQGVRLEAHGLFANDTVDSERRFASVEGELSGAVELMHPGRVLVGSVYAMDTWKLASEEVPFTHMAVLGNHHLEGFRWGRYIGPSALVAELQYRYPIHEHLDAVWLVSAGNVFERHFADFSPARFAGTAGVGLSTRFAGHDGIEALLAVGSRRFDEPFGLEGVRIFFGVNQGL